MKSVCLLAFFIPSIAFADNTYYCANTNQSVSVGETLPQVQLACGNPTSTSTSQQQVSSNINSGQQWIYTQGTFTATPQGYVLSQNVPSLIFIIQNGLVTQIQRSGSVAVGGLSCGLAQAIGINSTAAAVRIACGNPNYIQPYQQNNAQTHAITTWVYNHGPFQPQIIFTFTDGKLSNIQSGQLGQ